MALRVIDGVPGSGKTFYAVRHLATHYFKKSDKTFFDKVLCFFKSLFRGSDEFDFYELSRDCTIITNIDNFVPGHVDLRVAIAEAGRLAIEELECCPSLSDRERHTLLGKIDPVAEFFSFDYQEHYKFGKPQIVYVIDEAQRFFRKGADRILRERKVFDYIEYHRHWGQDIYMVTQNVKKLPPDIVHLPEYVISALPRVRTIGGGFKYHWVSSGEIIKRESFRVDRAVFALYKSMDVAESEKIVNPMLKTIGIAFLAAGVICYGGYRYFLSRGDRSDLPVAPVASVPSSGFGEASIPVGRPLVVEPEPFYVVFLPLDSLTSIDANGKTKTRLVWRDRLIPFGSFPHKVFMMSGQWYAVLDYEMFVFIFSDEDTRPSDFIVQRIDESDAVDSIGDAKSGGST